MQAFIVALITWACSVAAPESTTSSIEKMQPEENWTTQITAENDSLPERR